MLLTHSLRKGTDKVVRSWLQTPLPRRQKEISTQIQLSSAFTAFIFSVYKSVMDLKLYLLVAVFSFVALLETKALSIQNEDLDEDAKDSQISSANDERTRATWFETRELESTFKDLVYNALQQLTAEGKISSTVNKISSEKRGGRWQGFCFRKTRSGRFLPYICWKGGKK